MRSGIEFYRHAFQHEIEANHGMLKMLASVPETRRSEPAFQRAVNIAAHMVACRQGFLDVFTGKAAALGDCFEDYADFGSLERRFGSMETEWSAYFADLDDKSIDGMFVFEDNGERWKMSLEAQLFQLVGHAAYHRGQVVLLADSLGGETFDTDYIEWFTLHHPEGWGSSD